MSLLLLLLLLLFFGAYQHKACRQVKASGRIIIIFLFLRKLFIHFFKPWYSVPRVGQKIKYKEIKQEWSPVFRDPPTTIT